jgi:hypothetical protein
MIVEPTTIGISETAYQDLRSFESTGIFARLIDGYRFAVALGLSHNAMGPSNAARRTMFNVGSLDPDRSIYEAVAALREETSDSVYRTVERYADWGVAELARLRSHGEIDFGALLSEAEAMAD